MVTYKKVKVEKSQRYKEKKGFKQRVKNFFTIPEEVFQEEPSPQFARLKLFTLTRTNIFIGLFLFLLIINALIIFDVNFLYLRQILGFLFLVGVPGLLIMLCFKIRNTGFWEYLVYTVGLSIAFIMFAGLAVNWILPWLNITDKPLSLWPILICFDIFLVALGVVGFYRNKDFKPKEFTVPKLDTLNNIFFTIPMIFPVLSILGAFLLNNHGPNFLTMIMLGGIAVYVLLLTIFRKRLDKNIWPWAILLISISILLSGWLRSWFVSGPDISLEYWIFQLTKHNSVWNLSSFNNSYNSMLSLTILPSILSNFLQINDQFIFKLIIPIIFSTISLIIYLISRKILSHLLCFFSVLLFLSMPDFINWYNIPLRQEIGFIFFGLMFLVLFTKQLNPTLKKVLFVIFGASMIVSHYSTAYIALALFTLTYVCILIYRIYEDKRIKKGKIHPSQKSEFYLKGVLILLLLLFGFLWYSQVTPISDDLIGFTQKSVSNLGNMFNEDIRQGGATDPLLGFFNKPKVANLIEEYNVQSLKYDLSNKSEGFTNDKYLEYHIQYSQSKTLVPKISFVNVSNINYYAKQIISKIFQLFILFGLLYLINKKDITNDLKIALIGAGMIIFLFLLLPFFSIDYSLTRFIQQTFILLAPISILGGKIFFKKLKVNYFLGVYFLLILFFLLFSGFNSQLFGGDIAKMQLNNFGGDYDANYMFNQDYSGGLWLNENSSNREVYSDLNAGLKINAVGGRFQIYDTKRNILPNTISKKGYVYLSSINNIKNIAFFSINGFKISYNFPTKFLNENKNKIYNNGGSEIFK